MSKVAYGNRVIVDFSEDVPGLTKGGVQLPEGTRINAVGTAKVISVGPGAMTSMGWDKPLLNVGDNVTFDRHKCQVLDKENFIGIMWAGDVLAVERDADMASSVSLVEAN